MHVKTFSTLWALGMLMFAGCHENPSGVSESGPAGSAALVRVTPVKAARKTLIRYCAQPGQIDAWEEAPLFAKVSGYVRAVHVDIGDKVQGPKRAEGKKTAPGQTLVEIDAPELVQELAQKQAGVEQAKSEIKQAEAGVRVAVAAKASAQALVEEARASVQRAEADFNRASSELSRITQLADRQAVTDKLVDETKNKHAAAEAARKEVAAKIRSAQARLNESDAMVAKAEADLGSAKARLSVAEAERDQVKAMLDFTQIRAPFDGVVSSRNVDTGHLVNVGASERKPLLSVVNTNVVRVVIDVPEVDAVHVAPGAEATIHLPSLGAEGMTGKVSRTTWVLNQATRTLRTEVDVENKEGRLRPGMYATVKLKVAERPDAVTLPKTALITDGGETFCWKIEADDTLRRNKVQTGIETGGEVEIVSGLSGGEDIIGVNAGAFREGQQVARVAAK